YTVFDEFGSGWWHLAPYWKRGRRNRLLLRRRNQPEAGKTPAKPSSCPLFSLSRARLSMAILAPVRVIRGRVLLIPSELPTIAELHVAFFVKGGSCAIHSLALR